MSLSNSIIVLNTISTISLAQISSYIDDPKKKSLSLGYMERIVPCNHRKQRDSNIMRSISNKHQRTVLAEGIEPTDTHVFSTFADLHWKIQNKELNEDLFHTHITSSPQSKQQKRNNVKNAKLVLSLKQISLVEVSQFSPIFQLQKKMITNTEKEEPKWEKLRTFKLPRPGKVQYVVIGVKSLIRKYLKLVERDKQRNKANGIPQLHIRLKSKFDNVTIDNLFHLTKESGIQRPFLLLQYDKCKKHKRMKTIQTSDIVDESDAIIKRHAVGSARNALPTTENYLKTRNISFKKGCHLADNFIDFREGTTGDKIFSSRILHPTVLNIKTCIGSCACKDASCHAEGTDIDISNHARFKGLLGSSFRSSSSQLSNPREYITDVTTQCVPIEYIPQRLYVLNNENVPTILMLNDLVASKCGCR